MTLYKSFNQIGKFNQPPYPPSSPMGGCSSSRQHPVNETAPITDLPSIQELGNVQGFGGRSATIPNAFSAGMKPASMTPIRARAQELASIHDQQIDPFVYQNQPPMRSMDDIIPDCKQFSAHVENCSRCYKLYRRNHKQGALIIFLVFIIILLIIRLMDKEN